MGRAAKIEVSAFDIPAVIAAMEKAEDRILALEAALRGVIDASAFSAWRRDGEDVATVALRDLDRFLAAIDVAREWLGEAR